MKSPKESIKAVFLYCTGPRVQDIFDTLEDTGDDFEMSDKQANKMEMIQQSQGASPDDYYVKSWASGTKQCL